MSDSLTNDIDYPVPPFVKELKLTNFRTFAEAAVPLAPFTTLIGANAVGKTTVLDGFRLLKSAAGGLLEQEIPRLGSYHGLHRHGTLDPMSLSVHIAAPEEGRFIRYSLALEDLNGGWRIADETLLSDDASQPLLQRTGVAGHLTNAKDNVHVSVSSRQAILSLVIERISEFSQVRSLFADSEVYACFSPEPGSPIRSPQRLDIADTPGPSGETLISLLYKLRESEPDRYLMVENSLRAIFPHFENLRLNPVGGGMIGMFWKDLRFVEPIYQSDLSSGTLRFIWLLALLSRRSKRALILIDEIEDKFHPAMLHFLVEILREATLECQVIVTTHSDRFVSFLKPEELTVLTTDEEAGGTGAMSGSQMDLTGWLKNYSLDELWRMGILGGKD